MTRRPIDWSTYTTLDAFLMLIHGGYGMGKTHLVADALQHESTHGSARFVNIAGEDGERTVAQAALAAGIAGETVETVADFRAAMDEYKKAGVRMVGIDSMKALCRLVTRDVVKSDRPAGKDDYGPIHWHMENLTALIRTSVQIALCVCPSDRSVNQIDGKTYITPDLPGREAAGSAGWFTFVGYMTADVLGPQNVRRLVTFAPSGTIITRTQGLVRAITEPVVIPPGAGGWTAIRVAIEKASQP